MVRPLTRDEWIALTYLVSNSPKAVSADLNPLVNSALEKIYSQLVNLPICYKCKSDATTPKGIIYVRVGAESKPCCENCFSLGRIA